MQTKLLIIWFISTLLCNCAGIRNDYQDYLQDDSDDVDLKWSELMEVLNPSSISPKDDLELSDLAKKFNIEKAQIYHNGVYGKRGHVVLFATNKKNLHHPYQFYWLMVKVLSKKYGCFMKSKEVNENNTNFKCRDGRTVQFTSYEGQNWRLFAGRQFDRNGNEIKITSEGNLVAKLGLGR